MVVTTRSLTMYSSDASSDSIPSVSISRTAKSSHSKTDEDIQIPSVHGSSMLLILNTSFEPRNRDKKYDFPLRYGPHIDRTASGFLPRDLIKFRELLTTSSLGHACSEDTRVTVCVLGSYTSSSDKMSGREGGNSGPSARTENLQPKISYKINGNCSNRCKQRLPHIDYEMHLDTIMLSL